MNAALRTRVEAWIAHDPDARDRRTLQELLNRDDDVELERHFGHPLTFGTAGLRGPEMAGPAGMNRAQVRRATQGVLAWLDEMGVDRLAGVVVGRDARHGSETFNDEVVGVLLGAGARVYEMPGALPTPYVPYCVKALGAAAGIMITASHNPPQDNGYKLYERDGAQIIAPHDATVERYARDAGPARLGERTSPFHEFVAPSLFERYRSHFLHRFAPEEPSSLRVTYTPLHGVGGVTVTSLLRDAGYEYVTPVARQFEPDGDFPTLPFPNPEEPGALDLAIEAANASGSTLILANDPDADRLGAAILNDGDWHVLRGDEIGWLLASFLIGEVRAARQCVATTIVSSSMLEKMAASAGIDYVTTLTGFKWLARSAGEGTLGFGYEEALGYAVDARVADKDGLSAALALCRLADDLSKAGRTLCDRVDELEEFFGVHATCQLSLRGEGPDALDTIKEVVEQLRASPPSVLGALEVTETANLNEGWHGLAPTDGVRLSLGERGRVVVRPSGTEAKLKAYVEVTPERTGTLDEQRAVAAGWLADVRADLEALLRF